MRKGDISQIHYERNEANETNEQGKHVFNTELKCDNIVYGNGVGNKKHDAENNAAKNALEKCASLN
jgi:dsRNA-specific ribonuclease